MRVGNLRRRIYPDVIWRRLLRPAGWQLPPLCDPDRRDDDGLGGDGGAGAMKVPLACQFIRQQGEVEWLGVGQKSGQKIVSGFGPGRFVVAAGDAGSETVFVGEPLMAKSVELSRAEMQALCGRDRVKLAGVEGVEDVLNVEGWDPMEELFFS